MQEITIVRTPNIIAAEINSIKEQTQRILLCNSIEIGRRLAEAKAMVEHGEWGGWLKNSVDYSQRTASNLVRIFEEYGDSQLALFGSDAKSQALANLSYTQAVALLGVPEDEREDFIKKNDLESISTRQLQEAIKAQKEAEGRAEKAEKQATDAEDARAKLSIEWANVSAEKQAADKRAKDAEEALKKERQRTQSAVERLTGELAKARNSGSSSEAVSLLESNLEQAKQKIQELTEEINKPVTLDAAVVEKVPEEIERELNDLREKTKVLEAQNGHNAAVLKYGVYFESLVNEFKNLLGALAEIKETDAASHEKYKSAVIGLIGKISERLG